MARNSWIVYDEYMPVDFKGDDIFGEANEEQDALSVEVQREIDERHRKSEEWREQVNTEWRSLYRADNGWRSFDFEDYPYGGYKTHQREDYIKWDKASRGAVDKFLKKTETLEASDNISPGEWIDMLKEATHVCDEEELRREKSNSYYHDDDGDISFKYMVNEALLPTLNRMEKYYRDKKEERGAVIEILSEYAEETYNSYFEENPFTNEILISLISIGRVEGAKKAKELMEGFCRERIERIKEVNEVCRYRKEDDKFFDLQYNPDGSIADPDTDDDSVIDKEPHEEIQESEDEVNSYYYFDENSLRWDDNPFRFVHYALIGAVMHVNDWTDGEKIELAAIAGDQLKTWPEGSLGEYVKLFDYLGLANSLPILLNNLKSEDILSRRMSAGILYDLEMEKIAITSEDGVSYFDKIYELIKEDDPEFLVKLFRAGNSYVKRIDNHGRIGVFGDGGKLLGAFNLNLETDQERVKAVVRSISSKDIFLPKADETAQERQSRELMTEVFLSSYGKLFDQIYTETDISLNSLELYEQGWFVLSYEQGDDVKKTQLKEIARNFGELGLKVFLAADYGGTGEDILKYFESANSSREQKEKVLKHFFQITNKAYEWRKSFDGVDLGTGDTFFAEAHEALIRKCCEYFKAAIVIDEGSGGEVKLDELLESMDAVTYALGVLEGLREEDQFELMDVGFQAGMIEDENIKDEKAMVIRIFKDKKTESKVVVSIRPKACVNGDGSAAEARINFKVVPPLGGGQEVRVAFDRSAYSKERGLAEKPKVSLDLGTGESFFVSGEYQTLRVGRVLSLAEKSEGGHNEGSFSEATMENFEQIAEKFGEYLMKFKMSTKKHKRQAKDPKYEGYF